VRQISTARSSGSNSQPSWAPLAALLARAGHWCQKLDHPAYGCLYVALAEKERATLITADQRLLRKLDLPQSGLPAAIDLASFTG
jgi:predicted nucleic acid-binding protein